MNGDQWIANQLGLQVEMQSSVVWCGLWQKQVTRSLWKRLNHTHDLVYDMMETFYFLDKIDKVTAFSRHLSKSSSLLNPVAPGDGNYKACYFHAVGLAACTPASYHNGDNKHAWAWFQVISFLGLFGLEPLTWGIHRISSEQQNKIRCVHS